MPVKPKKLSYAEEERILDTKIRKHIARLQSGELRYPVPEVWVPDEEQAARTALLAVLQNVVLAA